MKLHPAISVSWLVLYSCFLFSITGNEKGSSERKDISAEKPINKPGRTVVIKHAIGDGSINEIYLNEKDSGMGE